MQGEKFRNPIKAEGKVVIVTGSNTGIGKETALELAKRKATVYLACRDLKKCDEARKLIILESKNKNVYCRELDLASFQSIKNFVKHFKAEQVSLTIIRFLHILHDLLLESLGYFDQQCRRHALPANVDKRRI